MLVVTCDPWAACVLPFVARRVRRSSQDRSRAWPAPSGLAILSGPGSGEGTLSQFYQGQGLRPVDCVGTSLMSRSLHQSSFCVANINSSKRFPVMNLFRNVLIPIYCRQEETLRNFGDTNFFRYEHWHTNFCIRTISHTNIFLYELRHTNF